MEYPDFVSARRDAPAEQGPGASGIPRSWSHVFRRPRVLKLRLGNTARSQDAGYGAGKHIDKERRLGLDVSFSRGNLWRSLKTNVDSISLPV